MQASDAIPAGPTQADWTRFIADSPVVVFEAWPTAALTTLFVTANVARLFGYTVDDVVGRDGFWTSAVLPEDRAEFEAAIDDALREGERELRCRLTAKNGVVRWVQLKLYAKRAASGDIETVAGLLCDVTIEIDIKRRFEAGAVLFTQLFENNSSAIAMLDRDFKYLLYSKRWLTDYGLGERDLHGLSHYDVFPETPQRWRDLHQRALAGEVFSEEEDPFDRADGRRDWVRWLVRPWYDQTGAIAGLIMFTEVITARKEAAEKLRRSEELYRALANQSLDIISRVTPDLKISYISPAATRALGYTPEELIGKGLELFHRADIAALAGRVDWMHGPTQFRSRYRHKDGHWVWLEMNANPVHDESTGELEALTIVSRDISVQKAAEDALKAAHTALAKSEESLRIVTDNSFDIIARLTPDVRVIYASPAVRHILGYAPEELEGVSFELVHDDDREAVMQEFTRLIDGMHNRAVRCRLRTKDEGWIWTELRINPLRNPETGAVSEFVAVARDVTDQKRFEDELIDARIRVEDHARSIEAARQTAEMANRAKSDFLATMSHELRTPMTGLMGMLDLLRGTLADVTQRSYADLAYDSAEGLLQLLNDLLDLNKIEAGQLKLDDGEFDLRKTAGDVCNLYAPAIEKKGVRFAFEVAADAPNALRGDGVRVRQVMFNLLGNAVKFTEAGSIAFRVLRKGTDRLRLEVADTGAGIPLDKQSQLFRPFVQADKSATRRAGGTGLGLAISKRLVEAMGGEIGFDSVEGRGSTFWFEIPLKVADAHPMAPTSHPMRSVSGPPVAALAPVLNPLRVLVVEDHPVNQRLIQAFLTRDGHTIDMVANGAEAVAAVQKKPYDVVLMDIQMPVMDGMTATRHIRALDHAAKDIPIIALTANAIRGDRERFLDVGMNEYVSKPIKIELLRAAIAKVVPGATAPLAATA